MNHLELNMQYSQKDQEKVNKKVILEVIRCDDIVIKMVLVHVIELICTQMVM